MSSDQLDDLLADQREQTIAKKATTHRTARLLTSQATDMLLEETARVPNVRIPSSGTFPSKVRNGDRLGWCFPRQFEYDGKVFGCMAMAELYIRMPEGERHSLEPFLKFTGPQAEGAMRQAQRSLRYDTAVMREVGMALWLSILAHPPLATWMAEQEGATFTTFYRERTSNQEHVHPDSPTRESMYGLIAETLRRRMGKIEEFKRDSADMDEESAAALYDIRLAEISAIIPDFSGVSLLSLGTLFRRDHNPRAYNKRR